MKRHLFNRYRLCLLLVLMTCACVQLDLSTAAPAAIPMATTRPRFIFQAVSFPTPTPEPTCFLPDLAQGQHISAQGSYTDTERTASTPMLCHIKRDSCTYHHLVGILEPTIVFKQEEQPPYDTEDSLLHPAMLAPLMRLNQLVRAEWGDTYRVRVTEAYDSLLEHDPSDSEPSRRYSLHYEGRAIDFTTWPVDHSRYSRLCALAHCAGFDWVLNEGSHCHASIRSDSLCFQCRGIEAEGF
jgi:hypothetical protein